MAKTAILILAAGNSSRMGTAKQLLPYKQTTLLGWSIKQAQKSKACDVYCVLGANAEIIKKQIDNTSIKIIINPNYNDGLSTSIVFGVNYLMDKKIDSILIMLADQPNVTTNYLNEMLAIYKENPTKTIASNYKNKNGVPAIFPKSSFNKLLNLKGDKGAKELLNEQSSEIIKMKPFSLIDIDTNEDYQNLSKQG